MWLISRGITVVHMSARFNEHTLHAKSATSARKKTDALAKTTRYFAFSRILPKFITRSTT